jgi:pimeloyl-ACP methyl ester carboxylesterase
MNFQIRYVSACALLVTAVAATAQTRSATGPASVDITWMSISNMLYEFNSTGILTDGFVSRVPETLFSTGADGVRKSTAPFSPDTTPVRRVLDALGGPRRVTLLLTGHSHYDHSLDTPTWARLTGAPIIGSKTTCLQVQAFDVPASQCRAVIGGERIHIADGVSMYVVRFNHSGTHDMNAVQHDPLELSAVPRRDPATGGVRLGVGEDYPNGGGNRAFLFVADGPGGRYSWFFNNSASAADLTQPIVVDGANYGAPLANLQAAMKDAGLESVDLWIGAAGAAVAQLLLPVLKPKAFLPVHWDNNYFRAFSLGVTQPFASPPFEAVLKDAGVELIRPAQFMDKWRLDRNGIRALPNTDVKRALGLLAESWTDPSPHTERSVAVARGVRLEVLDWGGNGPPIVFIPGSGQTAHSFDTFAPRLRDAYHLYGITRRGIGASTHTAEGFDTPTRTHDILAVLDSLGIQRAILVGHSFAGDELSKFAVTYPDRVRALVYLEAYDYGPAHTRAFSALRPPMQAFRPMTPADSASPSTVAAWARRIGLDLPESEIRATMSFAPGGHLVDMSPSAAFDRQALAASERSAYADIRVPALAIYAGATDLRKRFSLYASFDSANKAQARTYIDGVNAWAAGVQNRFRAEVKDGRVVVIPGANHFIFMSNPDEVERVMRDFLGHLPPQ